MNSDSEVVMVTGAGAGLGRAIAHSFGKRGATVGLLARGRERLEDAKQEIEAAGGKGIVLEADVADAIAVDEAASALEAEAGPIDIWVNDAMTTVFSQVKDLTPDEVRRVTEVTYLGFVHGTLSALKRMQSRNEGTIVQVGSALAYRSIPLQAAYCGAKHAMVGFTDSLRCELIHEKSRVKVTVVHMPGLNTPQFDWCENRMARRAQPVPPIFQPEDGAEAVYWAAHHHRREVFVGWPTIQAIWGQRLMPAFLDRYLANTAWEGQMYDGHEPGSPSNLMEPVPGHEGAHGSFDSRAEMRSRETWLTTRIPWAGVAVASALAGVGIFINRVSDE